MEELLETARMNKIDFQSLIYNQIDRTNSMLKESTEITKFIMPDMLSETVSLKYAVWAEFYFRSVVELYHTVPHIYSEEIDKEISEIQEEVAEILESEDDPIQANFRVGKLYFDRAQKLKSKIMQKLLEEGFLGARELAETI